MPRTATVFGVLLFVSLGVLAIACGGGMLLLGWWFKPALQPTEPVRTVLVYELAADPRSAPTAEQTEGVVRVFNRRLQSAQVRWGEARSTGVNRIEVSVYGTDATRLANVKRRLASLGTIEFRIVANRRDHAQLIETIAGAPPKLMVASDDENRRAAFFPLAPGIAKEHFADDPLILVRDVPGGDPQVLLVLDGHNVNGRYLRSASGGFDSRGLPCLEFSLDDEGAARFEALTSENLPDFQSGFSRRLAIILDGRVHSAPSIQSTIGAEGQITGDFSLPEVQELAYILTSGALPTPVKLIEERDIVPPASSKAADP
jgi:SecD/SecF fusion protein